MIQVNPKHSVRKKTLSVTISGTIQDKNKLKYLCWKQHREFYKIYLRHI